MLVLRCEEKRCNINLMLTELLIRGERECERERGEREQERGKRERERGERERARTSACNEMTEGQKFLLLQIFYLFHLQSLSLVCFFGSHVGHRILGCLFLDHQKREGGTLNKRFVVIGKVGATRRRSRSNQPPPQLRLGTHIFLIS